VKAHKTSGGRKIPVRHTIPLGIVIFLVQICNTFFKFAIFCKENHTGPKVYGRSLHYFFG